MISFDWLSAIQYSSLIALGAVVGAWSRWGVGMLMERLVVSPMPWGTLTVNLVGSLLFGTLVGVLDRVHGENPLLRAALFTGFLGAFTTFSTFSMDAVTLWKFHGSLLAFTYLGLSVAGGLLLAWGGFTLSTL